SEALHAPSDDGGGGDPVAGAGRVGSVLQLERGVGALARGEVGEGARRLHADLEAVSPDVREHRHRHRQRARRALGEGGALDGDGVPWSLRRRADARSADAGDPSHGACRVTTRVLVLVAVLHLTGAGAARAEDLALPRAYDAAQALLYNGRYAEATQAS